METQYCFTLVGKGKRVCAALARIFSLHPELIILYSERGSDGNIARQSVRVTSPDPLDVGELRRKALGLSEFVVQPV